MRTESGGYRRDHLRALAYRIEVDAEEVRIMGSKSVLLRTLVAASSAKHSKRKIGPPRYAGIGSMPLPGEGIALKRRLAGNVSDDDSPMKIGSRESPFVSGPDPHRMAAKRWVH